MENPDRSEDLESMAFRRRVVVRLRGFEPGSSTWQADALDNLSRQFCGVQRILENESEIFHAR